MARTLDQVLIELNAAYIARSEMMQGKRITKMRFASAESTTEYQFSDIITFEELQNYITNLEAERDMLSPSLISPTFRVGEAVKTTYRKGGI